MTSLDKIDLDILRRLQSDGRGTNEAIGLQVNLSQSAVSKRVQALEKQNYILAYRAVLNAEKLGLGLTVMTFVSLKTQRKADLEAFEQAVAAGLPNILECMRVSGEWDFLLKVAVADQREYGILLDRISALEQVEHTQSIQVLAVRSAGTLPI